MRFNRIAVQEQSPSPGWSQLQGFREKGDDHKTAQRENAGDEFGGNFKYQLISTSNAHKKKEGKENLSKMSSNSPKLRDCNAPCLTAQALRGTYPHTR